MSAEDPFEPPAKYRHLLDDAKLADIKASVQAATRVFEPVFHDLGLDPPSVVPPGEQWEWAGAAKDLAAAAARLEGDKRLLASATGSPQPPSDRQLARWRDVLWPTVHVGRIYRHDGHGHLTCETLQGTRSVASIAEPGGHGVAILVGQRREHVLSPDFTVEKFDANAAGWSGTPGTPGYPHHRWMRRHVARFAGSVRPRRILDFGCGAGWVGIEAALGTPGAHLAAFDPSPAMVRNFETNARAAGLTDIEGRTGFGEDPPFPAAGEAPFDLVLSSGVISFSPDAERWLDGLAATVAAGGTLVVGDLNRASHGMRARRRKRPLLPVRELNARTAGEVRAGLEARGFVFRRGSGYQLSWPVPQAMHFNKTRLGGALTYPLLWLNQGCAALDTLLGSPFAGGFDSWVMRFTRLE